MTKSRQELSLIEIGELDASEPIEEVDVTGEDEVIGEDEGIDENEPKSLPAPGDIITKYVNENKYTTAAGVSVLGGLILSYPLLIKANRDNESEADEMNKRILGITGLVLGLGVASTIKRTYLKK
tara:strand:- start:17 stop:391 length:375 start_codon:yes stop_codon:yes gene_type:complete